MTDTPAAVVQILPFPVRVIRWWQKSTIIFQLWTMVELAIPILLVTDFTVLGFSTKTAGWIMLLLRLGNAAGSITLTNKSSSIVGNAADVAAADAAPAPAPIETPTADPSPL